MKIAVLISAPLLPVIIFYLFDKLFNLKIKLVKLFKTTRRYKTTMLAALLSCYILFSLFLFLNDMMHLYNLPFSIIFLYHYLIRIPEEA
ncbi:MAG: hypothetical protein U9Q80_09410 [Bacillota bacterium]|nr:hypothetical protein [Bacillota bacterium]